MHRSSSQPRSVRGYGREAQSAFETMHRSLVDLVDVVVAVRYFGPNAWVSRPSAGGCQPTSRTACTLTWGRWPTRCANDLKIAASLGGAPIHIQIDNRPITPPVPQAVDDVDDDTAARGHGAGLARRRFAQLRDGLTTNLQRLQGDRLGGQRQARLIDAVCFTTSAHAKRDEANTLSANVTRQVQSVVAADRDRGHRNGTRSSWWI